MSYAKSTSSLAINLEEDGYELQEEEEHATRLMFVALKHFTSVCVKTLKEKHGKRSVDEISEETLLQWMTDKVHESSPNKRSKLASQSSRTKSDDPSSETLHVSHTQSIGDIVTTVVNRPMDTLHPSIENEKSVEDEGKPFVKLHTNLTKGILTYYVCECTPSGSADQSTSEPPALTQPLQLVVAEKNVPQQITERIPFKLFKKILLKNSLFVESTTLNEPMHRSPESGNESEDDESGTETRRASLSTKSIALPLPFLPHCIDYSKTCQGILYNFGLLTPCATTPSQQNLFCSRCSKNQHGYGTVSTRLELMPDDLNEKPKQLYVTPNGDFTEITYGTFLKKHGISLEGVIQTVLSGLPKKYQNSFSLPPHALHIDENYLKSFSIPVELVKKAGRPSRTPKRIVTGGEDDEEEEEENRAEFLANIIASLTAKEVDDKFSSEDASHMKKDSLHSSHKKSQESLEPTETSRSECNEDGEGKEYNHVVVDGKQYVFLDEDNIVYEIDESNDDIIGRVGKWCQTKSCIIFDHEMQDDNVARETSESSITSSLCVPLDADDKTGKHDASLKNTEEHQHDTSEQEEEDEEDEEEEFWPFNVGKKKYLMRLGDEIVFEMEYDEDGDPALGKKVGRYNKETKQVKWDDK